MNFTGWNLKCLGNKPNIILGKIWVSRHAWITHKCTALALWPLGYFKVLFSLSEQIHQVTTMWGSWWNVKDRMKNVYESESFKIRLPYLIKRNATCHSFDINFFLSFIFYLFNKYLLGSRYYAMPWGSKDQQNRASPSSCSHPRKKGDRNVLKLDNSISTIHLNVHLEWVNLIMCELYLNKSA